MDVAEKVKPQDKELFSNLLSEIKVLENLLNERKAILQNTTNRVIRELTDNPGLYVFEINPPQNKWELKLKPNVLAGVPGVKVNNPLRQN